MSDLLPGRPDDLPYRVDSDRPAGQSMPDESRRQLDHDVLHELSTIALLASLLNSSADLGPKSRRRAKQIMTEIRWLEKLLRSYQLALNDTNSADCGARQQVRLDLLIKGILRTARAHIDTHIDLTATSVGVVADRIALGRALRNLIWNALEAVGPDGRLVVRVTEQDATAVVDIEDDGPGFGARKSGGASLGLEIVRQVVASYAGQVEIGRSGLGGCWVRLTLPAVPAEDLEDTRFDQLDIAPSP